MYKSTLPFISRTALSPPPSGALMALCPYLRRWSSLCHWCCVGIRNVLDLALLAVLFQRSSLVNLPQFNPATRGVTYVPLGESQFHLSSALSGQSFVIFQASSNSSCGDGQVLVVAVIQRYVSKSLPRCGAQCPPLRQTKDLQGGRRTATTYVRPEAFHANAIL